MDTVPAPTSAFRRSVFDDALGMRHHADGPGGEPLEVFEVRGEFDTEAFERTLRERVEALAGFHSTWFAQVRTVQRINQNNVSKLFVVYDRVSGTRLSKVLAGVKQPLDVNAALCLIRQLVAGIALLHEKLPNIAHGAIAAERVLITPKARLVVTDHVLGAALEGLRQSTDHYWNELRVPLPNDLVPAFDQRADVMQIGILALELILGRHVARDEYPVRIHELTEHAWQASTDAAARGTGKALPSELRSWLLQMLQLDTERAFATAVDAWEELEHVLLGSDNRASFIALESVVTEYARGLAAEPTPPSMAASPAPASVRPSGSRPAVAAPEVAVPAVAPPTVVTPTVVRPTVVTSTVVESTAVPSTVATPTVAPPAMAATPILAPAAAAPLIAAAKIEDLKAPTPEPSRILQAASDDPEVHQPTPAKNRRWIAAAAAVVLLLSGGAFFGRQYLIPSAAAEAPGTLVVTTNPEGVPVYIDGQRRGVTPITVELAPGAHELRLDADGGPRVIPFTVNSGNTVSQTLELPRAAPSTGQLTVRSEPAGARVSIDGIDSGITPLTIEGLAPGMHKVLLTSDLSSVTQEVTVEPGTTASLVVPMTAPEGVPVSGWITVAAPAAVQVFEGGRLVGSSQSERIMVTAGRHEFDIVNEALGYRSSRVVTVAPGKVQPIRLEWPTGSLALNAQPWADVFIDGERVGETPLGNVTLPIGTHEVTFRHPQYGEQVVRATVTTTSPARVSVDMRKR